MYPVTAAPQELCSRAPLHSATAGDWSGVLVELIDLTATEV
jgi:hypothetical protein